jgi:hypothetical protein
MRPVEGCACPTSTGGSASLGSLPRAMTRATVGLDSLGRSERDALRALLIRATAAAGRPSVNQELAGLAAAAPIGALPAAAGLHRVAGTVLRGLDGVAGVPSEVHAELRAMGEQSSLHHLFIIGALSQIARGFDEVGLSWAVMKGPVVAALFYPDVGDRTYADLDLLVDRRGLGRAMAILEDLGFQHSIHNWALAEDMLAGQVGMTGPSAQVDLHWHLHYSREDRHPFALDPDAMLGRARRVVISGLSAPTLDPVDTLLALAFHAARSDGHRLVWLKDVERVVELDAPDLDELVQRCRAYRCSAPVGLILGRARGLLDAGIPDEIIRALVPKTLLVADRFVCKVEDPVQLHERATVTRVFTRSVRSSLVSTLTAMPTRAIRRLRRHLLPPRQNETDSPDEKASYLHAVAASTH